MQTFILIRLVPVKTVQVILLALVKVSSSQSIWMHRCDVNMTSWGFNLIGTEILPLCNQPSESYLLRYISETNFRQLELLPKES